MIILYGILRQGDFFAGFVFKMLGMRCAAEDEADINGEFKVAKLLEEGRCKAMGFMI